jgi:hypothetical protein
MKAMAPGDLPSITFAPGDLASSTEGKAFHMSNIVVVSASLSGEERRDHLVGDVWEIHDGSLTILDGVGHVVASYAPGRWVNVMKKQL